MRVGMGEHITLTEMKAASVKWKQTERDLEWQGNDFGVCPEGSGDHCCFPNREEAKCRQFFGKVNEFLKCISADERLEDTQELGAQTAFGLPGFQPQALLLTVGMAWLSFLICRMGTLLAHTSQGSCAD